MLDGTATKQLHMPPRLTPHRRESVCRELVLLGPAHEQRLRAEAFVQEVFYKAYQAKLSSFYPLLLVITRQTGKYAAIAGVRPAGGEPLFLEHYLGQPVEDILGEERSRIVEIGNLAPASAGQARWLICTMIAFLSGAGFTHVVFTAVPALHNAFSKMGFPLTRLTEASRARLPQDNSGDWGSYYDCNPVVYSGDIRYGYRALKSIIGSNIELTRLSHQAFEAGCQFVNTPVEQA